MVRHLTANGVFRAHPKAIPASYHSGSEPGKSDHREESAEFDFCRGITYTDAKTFRFISPGIHFDHALKNIFGREDHLWLRVTEKGLHELPFLMRQARSVEIEN
jgi:hypothetical protein